MQRSRAPRAPASPPVSTRTNSRALAVVDTKRRIVSVNKAFEQLVGWDAAALDGKRWEDVFAAPAVARKTARQLDAALEGRAQSLSLDVRTSDAKSVTAAIDVSVLRSKNSHGLAMDITSWSPSRPALGECVGGVVYEVSRLPFGTLKAVAAQPGDGEGPTLGKPCWEAIRGTASICPGCPAPDATLAPRLGVVDCGEESLLLVAARMVDSDTIRIATFNLDDDAIASVARARIERLAAQAQLTPREREVFDLMILGRSVRETGLALKISASTAKFHQTNVLAKLGVDSRLDLLRLFT